MSSKGLYPLIISIFVFLLYANTLNNSFVWDDHYFIEERTEIRSINHIFSSFIQDQVGVYRPVREFFYVLAYKLFGLDPFWYHLFGIIVHALNSILVFLILAKFVHRSSALLLALLFAAHPIHVEAVAFATSNFDVIGIVFFLAAFYFFINEKPKSSYAFFALAAFTYEVTLSLPFIILLYILTNKEEFNKTIMNDHEKIGNDVNEYSNNPNPLKKYTKAIPFFLIALSYISIRFFFIELISRTPVTLNQYLLRILAFPKVLIIYTANLLWPRLTTQHLIDYTFGYVIILSMLLLLIFFSIFRNGKIRLVSAFIVLALLPVSQIIPIQRGFAEMYAYLAVFGFVLLLYHLISGYKKQALAILLILLAFYSIRTINRNNDWKDDLALWESTVKTSPESSKAQINLALELARQNRLREAIAHAQQAIQISPDRQNLYFNFATILQTAGFYNESLTAYVRAIELDPYDTDAYINTAILLAKKGEHEKAEQILNRSIQIQPTALAHFNLAMIYKDTNRTEEAKSQLEKALLLEPEFTTAQNFLALLKNQ